jgi:hypothetical protein
MYTFKLEHGRHTEGGKTHMQGDVIESENDLAKQYGDNKFRRLHEESFGSPARKKKGQREEPESEDEVEQPAAAKKSPKKEEPPKKKVSVKKSSSKKKVPAGWEDVSDEFEEAEEADLLVFKADGEYFVTEKSDPAEPVNSEDITSKKKVRAFLSEYLEV